VETLRELPSLFLLRFIEVSHLGFIVRHFRLGGRC
jgi:hypothetical protein